MNISKDRVGGLLLLVFCLLYGWLIQDIRLLPFQMDDAFTARTMPQALTFLGVGMSAALIVFPGNTDPVVLKGMQWGRVGIFLALMSAYGLTIRPMGFIASTSVFLMVGFALLGERKPITLFLAAVPLVVLFWVLMTQGLDVFIEPLPEFLRGD